MKKDYQIVLGIFAIVIVILVIVTLNQSQSLRELQSQLQSPKILKSPPINFYNSTTHVNNGTIITGDHNVVGKEVEGNQAENDSKNIS